MPNTLPAGPYRTLTTPEGAAFPYYVIPFDEDGVCEGPATRAHLLAHLDGCTDVFLFSHGWNNDWTAATERYESFITGFQQLRREHGLRMPDPYRPLLVGIFWPSQAMAWFDDETGPAFAGAGDDPALTASATTAVHDALREIAASLPPERRQRLLELAQSERLAEGEDRELAELLAGALGGGDDEAGADRAPGADDLLAAGAALDEPEPEDWDAVGSTGAGDDATAVVPAHAGVRDLLRVLDPRNLLKPFTVWRMKDRAGVVGAKGVAPLLHELLERSDARVHLLGHSFGCKVVMTATCVMPEPGRPVESALLLQPAVSQFAFAERVPGRDVPGGFRPALSRVRQPIVATYSRNDAALSRTFHLALRRREDAGELQFAGAQDRYGALGGFGPQATTFTRLVIRDPGESYELQDAKRLVGVDGTRRIGGHGDISNPATWWASYSLLTAHLGTP